MRDELADPGAGADERSHVDRHHRHGAGTYRPLRSPSCAH
jgi:hypothetical protein